MPAPINRRKFLTAVGAAVSSATLARSAAGPAVSTPVAAPAKAIPAPKLVPPPAPSPSGAFNVGSKAQLFIDQYVVRSSERVWFTPHQARKHPGNPIMKADRPWEGSAVQIYGTVMFDEEERIFKMWYMGNASQWFPSYATHYATSRDGVHWEKPLVGTVKTPGLAKHNGVLDFCMEASVMKDPAEPDPARRYKMVAWDHRRKPEGGPHALISPDGLNWTRISTQNLFRSNDNVTAFYSRERKLFVAMPKLSTPVRGIVRRCFGITTSRDLLNWTEPRLIFQPDRRDDASSLSRIEEVRAMLDVPDDPVLMRTEFYSTSIYQAESCVVAFPWVFTINNNARFPTGVDAFGNPRPFNHEGPCEIQLGVSRDLETWERPFRTAVLPLGKAGEWDSGYLISAFEAFRYGDEVRLYYAGSNYTHGHPSRYEEFGVESSGRGTKWVTAIGLATWPLDRFVSADAGSDGGTLTTVPVHFTGNRLELNLNASRGSVRVEVLDASARPLAGFATSDPITSDSFRATVTWKGKKDLQALAGKPVCLRFHLKQAELYSFAFRA